MSQPEITLTLEDVPRTISPDSHLGTVAKVVGIEKIDDIFLLFLDVRYRKKRYLLKYLKAEGKRCWSLEGIADLRAANITTESDFHVLYLKGFNAWLLIFYPKFQPDDDIYFLVTSDFIHFREASNFFSSSPWKKDAVVISEPVNGRFWMIYLVGSSEIWICQTLNTGTIRYWRDHQLLFQNDYRKRERIIGLNIPLRTEKGWVVSYYYDNSGKYGLNTFFLSPNNPAKLIGINREPLLFFGHHFMSCSWTTSNGDICLFYPEEDRNASKPKERTILENRISLDKILERL